MASFCLQKLDVGLKKGKALQEGVVKNQVGCSRPSDAAQVSLSLLLAFVSHLGVHFSQPIEDQNNNHFIRCSLRENNKIGKLDQYNSEITSSNITPSIQ